MRAQYDAAWIAHASASEPATVLLADYVTHLARTGCGNIGSQRAARAFLTRWPDPRSWATLPLAERLAASGQTRPFLVFLMVTGRLHPVGYLVARKLASLWPKVPASPLAGDVDSSTAPQPNSDTHRRCAGAWPPRCWSGFDPDRAADAPAVQR